MTVDLYRQHVTDKGSIDCFGVEWKLLDDDLVRIITEDDIYEVKYSSFINNNLELYAINPVKDKELTDITIMKEEKVNHVMVLVLDTRLKEHNIHKEDTISARMKV